MQQPLQTPPLVSHPGQRDPEPRHLEAHAPRLHMVTVKENRDGDVRAVCSCGWVSLAERVGHLRLVCEVWAAEREGRRNAQRFADEGGPVEW